MKFGVRRLKNAVDDERRFWPGYLFGGRVRTSTVGLLIAFVAVWWVFVSYQHFEDSKPDYGRTPSTQMVPPGYIPDPSYTWVPRTEVKQPSETRAPRTDEPHGPATPAETTTPTTSHDKPRLPLPLPPSLPLPLPPGAVPPLEPHTPPGR